MKPQDELQKEKVTQFSEHKTLKPQLFRLVDIEMKSQGKQHIIMLDIDIIQ